MKNNETYVGVYKVIGIDEEVKNYSKILVDGDIYVDGNDNMVTHRSQNPNGPFLHIKGNLLVQGFDISIFGVSCSGKIYKKGIGNVIGVATV